MPKRPAMNGSASPSFVEKLHADRPAADRAGKMGLYGRLIGRWEMDAVVISDDGTKHSVEEARQNPHVLDGAALEHPAEMNFALAGTTLRVYDPGLDAWHILWNDRSATNV
jgi:hypothetical protein